MKRARDDDEADQESARQPAPAKRAKRCDPVAGHWCASCKIAFDDAAQRRELLTLDVAAQLTKVAQTTQQCPNFLCAYVVGLKLRQQPSLLVDLESISSDAEDAPVAPAPAPAAPARPPDVYNIYNWPPRGNARTIKIEEVRKEEEEEEEEEEEKDAPSGESAYTWPRPAPLVLEPVGSAPDADGPIEETPEEREEYEDRFDRAYSRLCRVPRAFKRLIRRRFWANRGFQTRNVHPNEARVVMDPGPHVYAIDGDATNTTSVSGALKALFEVFDSAAMSVLKVGKGRTKHCTTAAQVAAEWDKTRDNGTAFHAAMENVGRVERDRLFRFGTSDVIAEAPPGFYRFLEKRPYLVFFRCEVSVCHFASRLCGQADAVMMDSRTEELWLIDYKNTNGIYRTGWFGRTCTHPLTLGLPDCNAVKYDFQVNAYRHMMEESFGWTIARMLLLNFKPGVDVHTDAEEIEIKRRDMRPFFQLATDDLAARTR
jgi:hypothetical protein